MLPQSYMSVQPLILYSCVECGTWRRIYIPGWEIGGTQYSQPITHPSTNYGRSSLTSRSDENCCLYSVTSHNICEKERNTTAVELELAKDQTAFWIRKHQLSNKAVENLTAQLQQLKSSSTTSSAEGQLESDPTSCWNPPCNKTGCTKKCTVCKIAMYCSSVPWYTTKLLTTRNYPWESSG